MLDYLINSIFLDTYDVMGYDTGKCMYGIDVRNYVVGQLYTILYSTYIIYYIKLQHTRSYLLRAARRKREK